MNPSIFRKRIEQLVKESGLPIREHARRMKVTPGAISKWISGQTVPDKWETYEMIANYFGVPVSYLIGTDQLNEIDLKKALEEVEITWGGKKLTEEQKKKCRNILEVIIKEMMAEGHQ